MDKESKNQDILDYLMTSDFDEELTNGEFKALLLKFREFYRIHHSIHSNKLGSVELELKKTNDSIESFKNDMYRAQISNEEAESELKKVVNRKLTFMERLTGKINTIK